MSSNKAYRNLGAFGLLVIVFLGGVFFWLVPPRELILSGEFTHEEGFAWSVELPRYAWFSDSMTHLQMSPLRLFEDGSPLTKSHCKHKTIQIEGMGCYSHWGRKYIFSTSDNSSPNENFRDYKIEFSYFDLVETNLFIFSVVFTLVVFFGSLFAFCLIVDFSLLIRNVGRGFLFLSVSLFSINLYGVILGAAVYPHNSSTFGEIASKENQVQRVDSLLKTRAENDEEYFARLSQSVHDHMVFAWRNEFTRIPLGENYILSMLAYWAPDRFSSMEFVDPELALERRSGICSQNALVVYRILDEQNISAKMVGLNGHVVASAKGSSGDEYILDPDVGIVIPYGINEIENNPLLVEAYYDPLSEIGSGYAEFMASYYGPEGNNIYDMSNEYLRQSLYIERVAYLLKWLIPAAFAVFGVLLIGVHRFRKVGK